MTNVTGNPFTKISAPECISPKQTDISSSRSPDVCKPEGRAFVPTKASSSAEIPLGAQVSATTPSLAPVTPAELEQNRREADVLSPPSSG